MEQETRAGKPPVKSQNLLTEKSLLLKSPWWFKFKTKTLAIWWRRQEWNVPSNNVLFVSIFCLERNHAKNSFARRTLAVAPSAHTEIWMTSKWLEAWWMKSPNRPPHSVSRLNKIAPTICLEVVRKTFTGANINSSFLGYRSFTLPGGCKDSFSSSQETDPVEVRKCAVSWRPVTRDLFWQPEACLVPDSKESRFRL